MPTAPSASMSKKILRSMGRDGQRRRSPRISALDCKENHQNRQLPGRIKRKFDDTVSTPLSKLTKQVWKGRDSPQNADNSTDSLEWRTDHESEKIRENQKHDDDDDAVTNGKSSAMPAKHILELVLDTLQRRDTYEIFAEPVDPDEVEEYYEIIKEPMDFGTMRAKLHEGMYKNLQEFEHDVFLIPENAMHFNSSATIYFRQARAMHELAKKVFDALKRDPHNFVSEFSGTRRRSMRKALSESKDSRFCIAKTSDHVYSHSSTLQCPSTSTLRKMSKKKDHFMKGSKDSRLSTCEVEERRLTYLYNEKASLDSSFYNSSRPLVLMNQGDISYRDSLLSYVKDLGPTAQMVAKRKLLGEHESQKCQIGTEKCSNSGGLITKEFKTFRDFTGSNPFLNARNVVIDLTKDGKKEKSEGENDQRSRKDKTVNMPKKDLFNTRNQVVVGRDMNCSTSKTNDKARPVILALENSHSNIGEFKSRIKRNSMVLKPSTKTQPACGEAQALPIVSRFTFDLSFLKARLSQMNAVEIGGKLHC